MRPSGRAPDAMRRVEIVPHFTAHAEGSCLIKFGDTHVLVTASVEERLPPWLRGKGEGWVTAEYGMLPRATHTRGQREAAKGKQSGRTQEIQRLIGRSLRAVTDLKAPRRAPDHPRLRRAAGRRRDADRVDQRRVGRAAPRGRRHHGQEPRHGRPADDAGRRGQLRHPRWARWSSTSTMSRTAAAGTDGNFVLTSDGGLVEVQATAEGATYDDEALLRMLRLARLGCTEIFAAQRAAVGR